MWFYSNIDNELHKATKNNTELNLSVSNLMTLLHKIGKISALHNVVEKNSERIN